MLFIFIRTHRINLIIFRSDIIFGANEVTKSLEDDSLSSVLLASDVNPQFMVKHIVDMSVLKNRPILIVPQLRDVLKQCTGISSLAVGFKKDLTMDSKYWAIDQKIKEIVSGYPVPEDHVNFNRLKVDFSDSQLLESRADQMSVSDTDSSADEQEDPTKVFYLYRTTKKKRIFVPKLSREEVGVSTSGIQVDLSEFVAFNDNKPSGVGKTTEVFDSKCSSMPKPQKSSSVSQIDGQFKKKVSYKSLIIKRVRNNEERGKKKIEILKKKKI